MWRYRLLLLLLSLPLIGVSAWHAIRFRQPRLLLQRLGLVQSRDDHPLWIHAASVGEVNAVVPLIAALQASCQDMPIIVSTNTATGRQVLAKQLPTIEHYYLPIDWKFNARRAIKKLQPRCLLIVETEIWPNLFQQANAADIPLTIINGRISSRTLKGTSRFAKVYRQTLKYVTAVLARSEADRMAYIKLGVAEDRTRTVGNLKYAVKTSQAGNPIQLGRPYVLLASTRDDEEKYLVEQLDTLLADTLLVIVPRHPNRSAEIEKTLDGYALAVRSRNEEITADTRIYLADTLGELNRFIAGSRFVIMGGSFKPFGGQNILEVARESRAVVFGPYMENFVEEARQLLNAEAAIQVNDGEQLQQVVTRLLNDDGALNRLGQNGLELMHRYSHIIGDYQSALAELCNDFRPPHSDTGPA